MNEWMDKHMYEWGDQKQKELPADKKKKKKHESLVSQKTKAEHV